MRDERKQHIDEKRAQIYHAASDYYIAKDISMIDYTVRTQIIVNDLVEFGRETVLEDFDAVCMANAFMGFTDEEFAAVKKFFAFNNQITGRK